MKGVHGIRRALLHGGLAVSALFAVACSATGASPVPTDRTPTSTTSAPAPSTTSPPTSAPSTTSSSSTTATSSAPTSSAPATSKQKPKPVLGANNVVIPVPIPVEMPPLTGSGPRVSVIGDSITLISKDQIEATLHASGVATAVSGLYGYDTVGALPFTDLHAATTPEILLLELGTNDAGDMTAGYEGLTLEAFKARYKSITDKFPTSCIAVTTVSTHRLDAGDMDVDVWNEHARSINEWLRANYTNIIDWDGASFTARQAGLDVFAEDSVHPNMAGSNLLAGLFGAAVTTCRAGRS